MEKCLEVTQMTIQTPVTIQTQLCREGDQLSWFAQNCPSFFFFFFFKGFSYLFIYLFLAVLGPRFARGLSPVAASGGHSSSRCGDRPSSRCAGLSLSRPPPPRGTGSRRAGSAIVAHGPSCSAACGIPPDQGSNPCPLHQQADSQPLRHQGSPTVRVLTLKVLQPCQAQGQLLTLLIRKIKTTVWPSYLC